MGVRAGVLEEKASKVDVGSEKRQVGGKPHPTGPHSSFSKFDGKPLRGFKQGELAGPGLLFKWSLCSLMDR